MKNTLLINNDCIEAMDELIEKGIKVDLIITDPPYGVLSYKWDELLNFEEVWKRIRKLRRTNNSPTVIFGIEPFSSYVRMSNIKEYKYDWYWQKNHKSLFQHAKNQPLRKIELLSVFAKNKTHYNPQMVLTGNKPRKNNKVGHVRDYGNKLYNNLNNIVSECDGSIMYPDHLIKMDSVHYSKRTHPTEKPVELLEYIIKTYSDDGGVVLDFTMGTGSCGIACKHLNREFIGIEIDENYYNIAKQRIIES